jgi:uncharacterized protein (DUF1697 family)
MAEPIVVLLRGINVGGRNKVPMAELRAALGEAGFASVRTYIQSGNVIAVHASGDAEAAAAVVRSVIASAFGFEVPAIGVSRTELRSIVDANPYPEVTDFKKLHGIVLPVEPDVATRQAVERLQEASNAKGGRDAVTFVGRVAYLHTPDGFGTSDLAKKLAAGRGPLSSGTARNWATMSTLLGMADTPVTDP